jgi:hypothetical protein
MFFEDAQAIAIARHAMASRIACIRCCRGLGPRTGTLPSRANDRAGRIRSAPEKAMTHRSVARGQSVDMPVPRRRAEQMVRVPGANPAGPSTLPT